MQNSREKVLLMGESPLGSTFFLYMQCKIHVK